MQLVPIAKTFQINILSTLWSCYSLLTVGIRGIAYLVAVYPARRSWEDGRLVNNSPDSWINPVGAV